MPQRFAERKFKQKVRYVCNYSGSPEQEETKRSKIKGFVFFETSAWKIPKSRSFLMGEVVQGGWVGQRTDSEPSHFAVKPEDYGSIGAACEHLLQANLAQTAYLANDLLEYGYIRPETRSRTPARASPYRNQKRSPRYPEPLFP